MKNKNNEKKKMAKIFRVNKDNVKSQTLIWMKLICDTSHVRSVLILVFFFFSVRFRFVLILLFVFMIYSHIFFSFVWHQLQLNKIENFSILSSTFCPWNSRVRMFSVEEFDSKRDNAMQKKRIFYYIKVYARAFDDIDCIRQWWRRSL